MFFMNDSLKRRKSLILLKLQQIQKQKKRLTKEEKIWKKILLEIQNKLWKQNHE